MLILALLLQTQAPDSTGDSVYSTPALREFIARASVKNRAPPIALQGYTATVETEFGFILRDSLGRELVGQIEQLASRAEWERNGRYELHIIGFRSQSLGAPYSALTFTKMYTVPTLYGNRLVIGMNDGIQYSRADTLRARKRRQRDTTSGRDRYRSIHPLASDRDAYYRFTGGDTVTTVYSLGRAIRIARVHVEPVKRPTSNFGAFVGELDFDADRYQLVRMRVRLDHVTHEKDPLFVRGTGAVAMAYLEFENAEINGKYWLPNYQRSEFQAQMGLLGDTRPIYRIVSRFRNYSVAESGDTAVALGDMDSIPRTRAKLTFASKDSVSRYGAWQENLGTASGRVGGDDFDDLAPDVWKPTGKPRVDYWPRRLEDVLRYNRVEGMFTGVAASVRFRDMVPGLSARGSVGFAWEEQTPRGALSASLARGNWIHGARAERTLASMTDFMGPLDNGLSIGPFFSGVDDNDYFDRWTGALNATRILGNIDRAILTSEVAYVADRPEIARLRNAMLGSKAFRPNRQAIPADYGRASARLEWHPRVTGLSLAPGLGARLSFDVARGDVDWQRVEVGLAVRRFWHGLVFASRVDAGALFGSELPPQEMYELGGGATLPGYSYGEFGGNRAAIGRALAAYHFPVLRTPFRLGPLIIPGLSPGVGAGLQSGWTEVSSDAAGRALLAQGGDGVTPLSRPTKRIRGTSDFRFTLLGGVIGAGIARPIDHPERWRPFFVWGAAF
ncbi:MAG: hypothetical protein WD825_16715 [Gemmatimonadaceae bacterium]